MGTLQCGGGKEGGREGGKEGCMINIAFCRTLNANIGIMKFESDPDAIGMPVMADSLQVSPAGQRATVVVVSLNRQFLYVSRNYAKDFDRYKSPTVNFDPTEELYLSSFNPQHMVVRSRSGEVSVWQTCF